MNIEKFKQICKMSQSDLKAYVRERLTETHDNITAADGFVFAQGSFPVLLVAHLDTVHKKLPASIYHNPKTQRISALEGVGGDDRCGVYIILEIIRKYNCSVLFCEDEEIGGVGAKKFCTSEIAKTFDCNYIVELDRRGNTDAVFYQCDNKEFTEFVCKEYFKKSYGTFSDISTIAPHLGIAAVNLSSGYYDAHTTLEYVVTTDVDRIITETEKMLERSPATKFKYVKATYASYGGYGAYNGYYGGYYGGSYGGYNSQYKKPEHWYLIEFIDHENKGKEDFDFVLATGEDDALGKFIKLHTKVPYSDIIGVTRDDEEDEEDTANTTSTTGKTDTPAASTENTVVGTGYCVWCKKALNGLGYHTADGKVCRECYYDCYSL